MNTNQDNFGVMTPLSVFGGNEGAQTRANIPTQQLGGGFSFTPGGVTINGNQVQSTGGLQFDLPLSSVQAITQQALSFSANNSNLNRGFVGGVADKSQANLTATQNNVLGFGRDVMAATQQYGSETLASNERMNTRAWSGIERVAQLNYWSEKDAMNKSTAIAGLTNLIGQPIAGSGGKSVAGGIGSMLGCFITTAICEREGLADDCDILQTFRAFRDTYMQSTPANIAVVNEYYKIAPAILAKIQARKDGAEMLDMLRARFLMPAYAAIQAGDCERARVLYISMVVVAKTISE